MTPIESTRGAREGQPMFSSRKQSGDDAVPSGRAASVYAFAAAAGAADSSDRLTAERPRLVRVQVGRDHSG